MKQHFGYATSGRKTILEYLINQSDKAVTVNDILTYLKSIHKPKNPSTVYRYLDELVKTGQVLKHKEFHGEIASYQYISLRCHSHLHMQCSGCGKIIHLDCGFMDQVAAHLNIEHGFSLTYNSSILRGLCERCKVKI